jgi:hypothetical protein
MKRNKITANIPTPQEEDKLITLLSKSTPKPKKHRLTIDISTALFEEFKANIEKEGFTTISGAVAQLMREYNLKQK